MATRPDSVAIKQTGKAVSILSEVLMNGDISQKEFTIVCRKFGLGGEDAYSYVELAKMENISTNTIRRLVINTIKKMISIIEKRNADESIYDHLVFKDGYYLKDLMGEYRG